MPLAQVLGVDAEMAFFMHALSLAMFYAAHWEEYHSGHLVLGRLANPTEAQVGIMFALLGGAFLGIPSFLYLLPYVLFPLILFFISSSHPRLLLFPLVVLLIFLLGPSWFRTTTLASLVPFVTLPEVIATRSIGWTLLALINIGCVFAVIEKYVSPLSLVFALNNNV